MDGKLTGKLTSSGTLNGQLTNENSLSGQLNFKVVESSNYNYNKLNEDTLPQINNVMLKGNRTSSELHVQEYMDQITDQDIDDIIFG